MSEKFQLGELSCLPDAGGYLLLTTEEGYKVRAEGYTQGEAWWQNVKKPTHNLFFTHPEFIDLVLEGKQKIASLEERGRKLEVEISRLRDENRKLEAENSRLRERKRRDRVWYPVRNRRQLRAVLRKMLGYGDR